MSDLYRGVPPTSDGRPWRMVWMDGSGEIVDALPVEPVGTLTVDRYSDARSDVIYGEYGYGITAPHLPPGKYLIIPKEADHE